MMASLRDGSVSTVLAPASAPPPPGEAALLRAFRSARATRRQNRAFREQCGCTRALHREYATRYETPSRVLVIDGSGFRWEGLGNSMTRWVGLLRWGFATGRAVFLHLTEECATDKPPSDTTCHLDIGDYFSGWGGVQWHWSRTNAQPFAAQQALIRYSCAVSSPPGCSVAALTFANGSRLELREPQELLRWFRSSASPNVVRLRLSQQNSLEFSYGKPESLRSNLERPFTHCDVDGVAGWRDREMRLKCETFAFLQARWSAGRLHRLPPALAVLSNEV